MNERTDDEWVIAAQRGEADGFNQLVYRYKNSLYQYILAMTRDSAAAEDIFQDVFLNFYRRLPQYRPEGKLKSYLFTAARNRILNYFRDRGNTLSLDETDEDGRSPWQEALPSPEAGPLKQLEQQETAQRIRRAAQQLPPRQREVIYLKQYMTFKEAAQLLNRPIGTVLADHHRGIQKMQNMLQNEADL